MPAAGVASASRKRSSVRKASVDSDTTQEADPPSPSRALRRSQTLNLRVAEQLRASEREAEFATSARPRTISHIIKEVTKDGLNERGLELDKWVCRTHTLLTVLSAIIYALESIVGVLLLVVEWSRHENQVMRVFLLARICSYWCLIWVSWDKHYDFEASHPGLHLPWTMVHTLCVVTLISAHKSALRTMQGCFMFATVFVDNGLPILTWWLLRRCRLVVARAIHDKEIHDIHPASRRYLDFIPPAANSDEEHLTARHLLWQTVHAFEEVRDQMGF